MSIIATNFQSIVAKREPKMGKVSIKNNLSIKDVLKMNMNLGTVKQEGLRFMFRYESNYEPGVGKIEIEGDVLYMETSDRCKELLEQWKAKKLDQKVMAEVMTTALRKSSVKALNLSQDLNLPPAIKLPKAVANTKQ